MCSYDMDPGMVITWALLIQSSLRDGTLMTSLRRACTPHRAFQCEVALDALTAGRY